MPKRQPDLDEKRQEAIRQLTLAEQGDASNQNAIAAKLAQGYFLEKDPAGALYWYAQAVKQGYTPAKWNAGTMLLEGEGIATPQVDLGMKLIEQAAEGGDSSACQFLSDCYARGSFGKECNPEKSKRWRACAMDHETFVEYGQSVDIENCGIILSKPHIGWR